MTAIAERAGVGRLSVYRHFPDELTLGRASLYWERNPLPNPTPWQAVVDPRAASRSGRDAYHRRTEAMIPYADAAEPDHGTLLAPGRSVGAAWRVRGRKHSYGRRRPCDRLSHLALAGAIRDSRRTGGRVDASPATATTTRTGHSTRSHERMVAAPLRLAAHRHPPGCRCATNTTVTSLVCAVLSGAGTLPIELRHESASRCWVCCQRETRWRTRARVLGLESPVSHLQITLATLERAPLNVN